MVIMHVNIIALNAIDNSSIAERQTPRRQLSLKSTVHKTYLQNSSVSFRCDVLSLYWGALWSFKLHLVCSHCHIEKSWLKLT